MTDKETKKIAPKQPKEKSKVYIKKVADWASAEKISQALLSVWQQIEIQKPIKNSDFLALKLTFGEEETSGYIKPEWLLGLIAHIRQKTENLFIAETNTLYRERRSNAVGHLQVAHSHGYDIQSIGIPIIIADGLHGRDGQNISIKGEHFEHVKIARAVCESDRLIALSHVTGHIQSGFAGSLKNLGMGCAARVGKLLQHSKTLPAVTIEKCIGCGSCMKICPAGAIGLKRKKAILVKERCIGCGECTVVCRSGAIEIKYDENVVKFQEKMVEYALGVKIAMGSEIACINLAYSVTKNCDCMSKNESQLVPDIGIIGSVDPVAVDKASLDIVGLDVFKQAHAEIDPLIQIRHGEKIGLGSGEYDLIEI